MGTEPLECARGFNIVVAIAINTDIEPTGAGTAMIAVACLGREFSTEEVSGRGRDDTVVSWRASDGATAGGGAVAFIDWANGRSAYPLKAQM